MSQPLSSQPVDLTPVVREVDHELREFVRGDRELGDPVLAERACRAVGEAAAGYVLAIVQAQILGLGLGGRERW